jgi:protein disulfide-isomerase
VVTKENLTYYSFFTGSDWCGWCIKLQNEVLKTTDSKKWAAENVVLVELIFQEKSSNARDAKSE